MWHPVFKWKYEDGYLVNLALGLALTPDSGTLTLAEKTSDSQKWRLDYNGNIYIMICSFLRTILVLNIMSDLGSWDSLDAKMLSHISIGYERYVVVCSG